mgnify:FL=1
MILFAGGMAFMAMPLYGLATQVDLSEWTGTLIVFVLIWSAFSAAMAVIIDAVAGRI